MRLSKPWMIVASVGHGMLLAMAISGGVRIVGAIAGQPVSPSLAGNVFLIGSLILGPIMGYLNTASWIVPQAAKSM
jgi:hypothetical protein